jgi:hypothetical protein
MGKEDKAWKWREESGIYLDPQDTYKSNLQGTYNTEHQIISENTNGSTEFLNCIWPQVYCVKFASEIFALILAFQLFFKRYSNRTALMSLASMISQSET